ncbi:hypothetical protein JTZ10_20620 [Gordonia rubripertincta]|uniref:Uncharacterized protein n=1 Tax=Gordonia rubripertincta TaxID=36822 RepID=A0AAW4GAT6_GORRU|nr:hypothetical protein [Gordonia rubripertincta]MBM7280152.1 hypothetical protein [Gordonia rubripertincta]QMU22123.1 hypothetical protein H3V45_06450 [Gordonia rubripertincta]
MVSRASEVSDLEHVMSTRIDFVADPEDRTWYVGTTSESPIYIRMGDFPDEEAYSLYLGHGRWMDFSRVPDNWTITTPPQGWPESARPRLPKGEFHD